jgi:hypothetical protein
VVGDRYHDGRPERGRREDSVLVTLTTHRDDDGKEEDGEEEDLTHGSVVRENAIVPATDGSSRSRCVSVEGITDHALILTGNMPTRPE